MTLSIYLLVGCAVAPPLTEPMLAGAAAPPAPPPPATAGAIYREGGGGLALFQDQKAHRPGDLLTIVLQERTTATTSASTSLTKDSSAGLSVPSLLGAAPTAHGRAVLDSTLEGGRDFSGKGDSAQSNRLEGNLTVTVAERLPNGNLLVRGEKRLRINQGDELVQIQGIVRPADIAPDNSIPSHRVADARIVYTGRGTLAQSNAAGWLTRFFNSPLFPF